MASLSTVCEEFSIGKSKLNCSQQITALPHGW